MKDKKIDDQNHKEEVYLTKSEFHKTKSSTLADCKCKRIFNVDEETKRPPEFACTLQHSLFTDTLRKLEREPSEIETSRSQFLKRSKSMREDVRRRQDWHRDNRLSQNDEALERENKITQALRVKAQL